MGDYAGLTVFGASGENERAGYNVSIIGDVNGDGLDDFAVSAPYADVNVDAYYGEYTYFGAGAVYVVFGDGDLPTSFNLDEIDGDNGFRVDADVDLAGFFFRGGAFGQDVVGLGDVNGDGVDDFGISQAFTGYSGGFYGEGFYGYGQREGVVYVVYGGQDFGVETAVGDLAGFRIDTNGYVNDIVALGDINGDGFNDVGVNAVDVAAYGQQFVDYYYLYDYDGNGVFDENGNDFYFTGQVGVNTGKSSGFVIFGTDAERVSDEPIADGNGNGNGGPVFEVALLSLVADDAPTTNETIVNTTQLDGGDGFEIITGRTVNSVYGGEFGFYFGVGYDSAPGGMIGLGDINGDGFDDIGARNLGYYSKLFNGSYDSVRIVRNADGETTITPDLEGENFLYSGGDFLILGRDDSGAPFAPTVDLSIFDPEVDFQAFLGNDFNPVTAGVGDVSGNDGRAEIALAEFLGQDDPNNPTGAFVSGVAIINGTDQPPLSDSGLANEKLRDYNLNDVINGQGAFLFDSTSKLVNGAGEVTRFGFDIEGQDGFFRGGDADIITALGDINGDGVDDFGLTAQRFYQRDDEYGYINRSEKAAYLIFGTADPMTGVIDLGATFGEGVDAADRLAYRVDGAGEDFDFTAFGYSLGGVGDVDGDGFNDIIFGAPYTDGPFSGGFADGAAFVLFGGLDALAAADAADGFEDGVINTANLGVNVETGVLPIEVGVRNAGFFSEFRNEGDSGPTVFAFEVERTGDLSEIVSFDFQVAGFGGNAADGADFVGGALPGGSTSFGVGEATVVVEIEVQGDVDIEATEDFSFTISNASTDGASPISIVADETFGRIFNDDFPVRFRIDNATVTEGDAAADGRELVFNVRRSGEIDVAATVDFEIQLNSANAADFENGVIPASGTVSFAAGETLKTIVLPIEEDVVQEFNESVFARLSNATADQGIPTEIQDGFAVGTILNDDFPPQIRVLGPGSRFEGDFGFTPFTFTIQRLGDTTGVTDVVFDLNPLPAPGDFFAADSNDVDGFLPSFGNTIRFEDGESEKTFTVNVNGDGIIEPRESFELRVTQVNSFNGVTYDIFTPAATATIVNDDGRPPIIPPGVEADVFGDPHIVTLDGLGYDFQAVGEYILVETEAGAANPFQVQVRFEPLPGSDLVSVTTRLAVQIDGVTVEIDALGADPLLVDGVAPSAAEIALGALDVNGDGTADVFFDSTLGMFTIVLNDENEQLIVKNASGALNACVFLSDATDGNAGGVRGLMGDGDSDGTADDLALRDGTVLPQPLDFATLYGAYADSWRVDGTDGKDALFSNTVAFPADFPATVLTLDDLPADLVALATEAALAAGLDPVNDPEIFEAAVLDFALTGDASFFEGALGLAAEVEETTEPEDAPALGATISVAPGETSITEGDAGSTSALFTFFRIGDATGALTVDFEIGGDVNADDIDLAPFGDEFFGSVSFADGQTSASVSISVRGDLTTEADEKLTVSITDVDVEGVLVAGSKATTTVLTDDFAPDAIDDVFSTNEDTRVVGNVFDANPTTPDDDADGDALTVTQVTDSAGTTRNANGGLFIMDSGAHLRINGDGSFTYDPFGFTVGGGGVLNDTIFDQLDTGEIASETFTYLVTDGNGGFDEATVTINVTGINDAPFAQIDSLNLTEDDASAEVNVIAGTISPDFDPEGGEIKVTEIRLGSTTVAVDPIFGATLNLADGGRLEINQAGDAEFFTEGAFESLGEAAFGQLTQRNINFTYTIEDESGLTASALFQVFVKGVNDGPVADNDTAEVDEDGATLIDVLLNDFDAENDALTITDIGAPSHGTAVEDNGQISYTPFENFFGEDSFTYEITDAGGETSTATVTVTVLPVNDAPIGVADFVTTDEDTPLLAIAVLDNDIDLDGDDVFEIDGVDVAGTIGQVTVNAFSIDYDPNGQFDFLGVGEEATDTFDYFVRDQEGELGQATVTVTITGVNDEPDASDDEATTDEDTPIAVIDVLGNDEDRDRNDVLAVTSFDVSGTLGVVTDNGDGTFSYDPNGAFEALSEGDAAFDTFAYTISDGKGGEDTATVTITVNGVNDRPDAVDDFVTTDEDTPLLAIDVLANDEDDDANDVLSVAGVDVAGTIGQVTANAFSIDYDPNGQFDFLAAGAETTDTFAYTISDGNGGEDTATVTVTITGVNDLPEFVSGDAFEVAENTTFVGDVAAEDVDVGDTLAFSILTGVDVEPDGALFEIDATTGALSFLAPPDFEAPADLGGDNVYNLTVAVTDGVETVTQDIAVTVTDVDENVDIFVDGTDGRDNLAGTEADEIFRSFAGASDSIDLSDGGSDIVRFGDETANNIREREVIFGFGPDDFLDLGGAEIVREINRPTVTLLQVGPDKDLVYLIGVADFDESTQLIGGLAVT